MTPSRGRKQDPPIRGCRDTEKRKKSRRLLLFDFGGEDLDQRASDQTVGAKVEATSVASGAFRVGKVSRKGCFVVL